MARLTLGNLDIDRERYEARVGGEPIDLTFGEFKLLWHLARRAGAVVPQEELLQALWGEQSDRDAGKLRVQVSRLRKKVRGSWPWTIKTVQKRGYALADATAGQRPDSSPVVSPAVCSELLGEGL